MPPPHPPARAAAARTPARLRAAAGTLALALTAACVDRTATGPEFRPPPDVPGAVGALSCRADVRAGTVQCTPASGTGGGSAVILGGQGVNVRLRSTGMSYDGTSIFRMDVTVENLTGQALGTMEGGTPAPEGVRVFFASGPTSATGTVEVANATGEAFFTAAGQKYFQYEGLLAPGDTTAPLEWRFSVPPTVASFQFGVYVAAAVRHEAGWLRLAPILPSIAVGESMQLSAQLMDVAGRPQAGAPVTWTSGDTTVARVAADGTVTGVATGATFVFASDGTRTSDVHVRVFPSAGDAVPPTLHELTLTPPRLTADGADSVTVWARVTDGRTGTRFFSLMLRGPAGVHQALCISYAPATGTRMDGTFTCRAGIPPMAEGGTWPVFSLTFADSAGNQRFATADPLRQAGVPWQVFVQSATPDLAAPAITGVAFAPDSVEANGMDSTTVELQVADGGTGVAEASAWFRSPSGYDVVGCAATTPSTGNRASGTFRCRLALPFGRQQGNWTLEVVRARDLTENTREMNTQALDSAGYPTVLRVFTAPPDTVPPSLTGFSFTPDTVAANGLDSVTVSMELTDAGSGAYRAEVYFLSPSNQIEACGAFTPERLHRGPQVITCRLAIRSGRQTGEWRVYFIGMRDAVGNQAVLGRAALQAMGYPVFLTVTP